MRYQRDNRGRKRATLIAGDGIGPEVLSATREIIEAAGVDIASEEHEAGTRRGAP